MNALSRRAGAVALGLALDRVVGEPPAAIHPVALFGNSMTRFERLIWADDRLRGVGYTATGVGIGLFCGRLIRFTSAAVALAVAGRQLRSIAGSVGRSAQDADLEQARQEVGSIVGRDVTNLDASGVAAAAIESLAENTVDSTFSAAFWGLLAGARGACTYRAVNTMDAMVGHHSEHYERFGWSVARLDDLANWVPARIFALTVGAVRPEMTREIARIVRRDSASHPSPNAGVAESAVAAAIGRQLGGSLRYGDRVESRPTLGDGPRPLPGDVARAVSLVDDAEMALMAALGVVWLVSIARDSR